MTNDNTQSRQGPQQDDKAAQPQQSQQSQQEQNKQSASDSFDALANKKPEELTPEELRLMADTMPGEGPGD
ncbi:hypothetical protein [Massilia sp. Mn16-1_5]|uniref:hypothetical protein n=1 Tax=Massilia sp. Mn16-1_5 TaxID=2079199 RepID=UPI00109EB130|nr:hypothetical protein [Massilia sp. Mn16-1_5]